MTFKDSALAIAEALAAAHQAHPKSEELDTLHSALKEALEEHADELDLDDEDIEEIEGILTAARGGVPKD